MVKYIKLVLQAACAKIYASLIFSQNGTRNCKSVIY